MQWRSEEHFGRVRDGGLRGSEDTMRVCRTAKKVRERERVVCGRCGGGEAIACSR